MIFRFTVIAFVSINLFLSAQAEAKNCRKGIPCGNTCIAAWKTCHIGSSAMPEPLTITSSSSDNAEKIESNDYSSGSVLKSGLGAAGTGYNDEKSSLQEEPPSKRRMSEDFYRDRFCTEWGGKPEVTLDDKTRVDCLTVELAIEFDFAKKWAESIGQSLHYGRKTNKTPAIALIMESEKDQKYLDHLIQLKRAYGLPVRIIKIYNK